MLRKPISKGKNTWKIKAHDKVKVVLVSGGYRRAAIWDKQRRRQLSEGK